MGRYQAWQRRRALSILAAGSIGYVIGGWHAAALRSPDLSPAQTVALRFPVDQDIAAQQLAASDDAPAGISAAANPMVLGDPRLALLSPAPMVAQAQPQTVIRMAAAEEAAVAVPPPPESAAPRRAKLAAVPAAIQPRPVAPAHRHAEQRAGFMLNDAQIASIKERLHLTPDQEQMWPGVEAALRNIAYAKARDAQKHGEPAGVAELASLSPESAEVQDLKSAAFPLIMSFSDEQKSEVRNLAHVMGLDRLAAEF
jgi:hypothetical protein